MRDPGNKAALFSLFHGASCQSPPDYFAWPYFFGFTLAECLCNTIIINQQKETKTFSEFDRLLQKLSHRLSRTTVVDFCL